MKIAAAPLAVLALAIGEAAVAEGQAAAPPSPSSNGGLVLPGERHFANLLQLTFGGENAEAYFSSDAKELIFQSTRGDLQCDAIFRMNSDGTNVRQVSSGKGATTCSFIAPDNGAIIYASTHLGGEDCPPKPDYSRGYVWALYPSYDIFRAGPEGQDPVRLTETPGYDAEGVYSPQGDRIVFTSVRTGDLELFLMDPMGGHVEQLTDAPGYDGGGFFSRDGRWIVWRASRPEGKAREEYRELLAEGLIRPRQLDLYVMRLDDRKPIRLTHNGAANFAPYWHPDGRHVIFASNLHDPKGRDFDLYLIDVETRELERVTRYTGFDGFPMFSYDGKQLVFASNRNGRKAGETNVFLADWVW
jgi:TolB protein